MDRAKRKIGFYYLELNTDNLDVQTVYRQVIDHIDTLTDQQRKRDFNNNKFGFLSEINNFEQEGRKQLLIKSGTHSFRPPLMDSNTVAERQNPKTRQEGERIKTHIISKEINGDLLVLLEKSRAGVSIEQFTNYLNNFILSLQPESSVRFYSSALADEDFLEKLNSMSRIVSADIFVEKQLLGSEFLNYSERTASVQHEVMLTIKARRGDSIADTARDLYAKATGGNREVRRIRVVARNRDNNEVKINTEFVERQEYVNPVKDSDTGEVDSEEIFIQMDTILYNNF